MNPSLPYFAGLFDGEGSVTITLQGGKARWRPLHVLTAVVAMCHEEVIYALREQFGGDVRKEGLRAGSRQQWRWRIGGAAAARFLSEVEPYLVVKREQALLGIEFFAEKKRYKTLPIEELEKRESYRQRMWELNGDAEREALGLPPTRIRRTLDLTT